MELILQKTLLEDVDNMTITPLVISFATILMKLTILLYSAFIVYNLGKHSKITDNVMDIVWLFSVGGCFFLWAGLSLNEYMLIKGGIFINSLLALILTHQILTKHYSLKKKENEKIN